MASGLTISGIAASTRYRPTEKFIARHVPHYAEPGNKPPAEILWLADMGILAFLGLLSAFLVAILWDRVPTGQ